MSIDYSDASKFDRQEPARSDFYYDSTSGSIGYGNTYGEYSFNGRPLYPSTDLELHQDQYSKDKLGSRVSIIFPEIKLIDVNIADKIADLESVEPRLSILRPEIKVIDANLADRFADLQSKASKLTALAALFFGISIAALIVTFLIEREILSSTILAVAFDVLSIPIGISLYLALNANRKAREARSLMKSTAANSLTNKE